MSTKSEVREILVVSLSNLGDVILTTPVMTALREFYPKAFISVVIGPKAECLLRGSQTIDKVIIYDKKKLNLFGKLQFVGELRKRPYDLVIDLRNTLIPYLVKARQTSSPFNRPKATAMRERHLEHLRAFQISIGKGKFHFFSEQEARSSREKLFQNGISWEGGFVVIAPGAGNYFKRWPVEYFKEVAGYFLSRGKQVIVVGSEDEKNLGEAMQNHSGKPANLCGAFSLRELAAVLHDADLVLCCDSGIMHLANELNAPVTALFGPTNENQYAKFGPYNRVIKKELPEVSKQDSMKQIPVRDVIQACEELLSAEIH